MKYLYGKFLRPVKRRNLPVIRCAKIFVPYQLLISMTACKYFFFFSDLVHLLVSSLRLKAQADINFSHWTLSLHSLDADRNVLDADKSGCPAIWKRKGGKQKGREINIYRTSPGPRRKIIMPSLKGSKQYLIPTEFILKYWIWLMFKKNDVVFYNQWCKRTLFF